MAVKTVGGAQAFTPPTMVVTKVAPCPAGCPWPASRLAIPPKVRTWDGAAWDPSRWITILNDTFSRSGEMSGSYPDMGGRTWGGTLGVWALNGTQMVAQGVTNGIAFTVGGGDVIYQLTGVSIDTTPSAAQKTLRVRFKYATTNNSLFLDLAVNTDGQVWWTLNKNIAGAGNTVIVSGGALGLTPNSVNTFNITITAIGTAVIAVVNGVTATGTITSGDVTALTDSTNTVGISTIGAGTAGWAISSISLQTNVLLPPFTGSYRPLGTWTRVVDSFSRSGDPVGSYPEIGGDSWTLAGGVGGLWSMDGSKVLFGNATSGINMYSGTGDVVYNVISFSIDTTPSVARTVYIVVKKESISNQIYISFTISVGGVVSWSLEKVIGGTPTTIVSGGALGLTPNAVNTFDIQGSLTGLVFAATVNGVAASGSISSSDATALANATMVGLHAVGDLTGTSVTGINVVLPHRLSTVVSNVSKLVLPDEIRRWNGTGWEVRSRPGRLQRYEVLTPDGVVSLPAGVQPIEDPLHPGFFLIPETGIAAIDGHPHLYSTT